jgi:hypothetical protein
MGHAAPQQDVRGADNEGDQAMSLASKVIAAHNWLISDPDRFPQLTLECSSECNRNCSWCPLSTRPRRPHCDLDAYKIIADLRKNWFLGSICFSWLNEPLMRPDFMNILYYAADRLPWCRFQVLTNGDHLHGQLRRLTDLAKVDISVHPNPCTNWEAELSELPKRNRDRVHVVICTPDTLQARCGDVKCSRPKRTCCDQIGNAIVSCDGYLTMCCNDYNYERVPPYHVPTVGIMQAWRNRKATREMLARWVPSELPEICKHCTAGAALTIRADDYLGIVAKHGRRTADWPGWSEVRRTYWHRNRGTINE